MTPDQISTFQAVSGTSVPELNLIIRGMFGGLLFMWACWVILAAIDHLRHERSDFGQIVRSALEISCVLTLGLILIAIKVG